MACSLQQVVRRTKCKLVHVFSTSHEVAESFQGLAADRAVGVVACAYKHFSDIVNE